LVPTLPIVPPIPSLVPDLDLAIREELWRRGELGWKLHAGQLKIEQAFRSIAGKLFVGNCSRQFGKSFWAVTKAVELAIQKPRARIRYGAAFQTDLEEFILPAFDAVLQDCPEDIRPQFIAHKSKYVFKNGAEIKLVGLDRNPNGLRGNALDLIILDECGFISRLGYLYRSVIIPSTTHRPDAKIILISTPPETPAHEFVEFCQSAEQEGRYVMLDVYQNPMLTPQGIQKLMDECGGADSTDWKREYLCLFVVDGSRAIVSEWLDRYCGEPVIDEFYGYYHRYDALDIGVKRDLTVTLYAHYDFRKATLFIHDESVISGPSMTTEGLAQQIKQKELDLWGKERKIFLRIADNSHPLLVNDLAQLHDLPFVETDKEKLHEMVNLVKIWIGAGRVVVSPRCKQLLGCLRNGIWNEKRTEFDRSKVYGHFDALAALVYLIRNIDETFNPIPAHHGMNRYTHYFQDTKNLSPAARELSRVFLKK
jgi:hypothetical protein